MLPLFVEMTLQARVLLEPAVLFIGAVGRFPFGW